MEKMEDVYNMEGAIHDDQGLSEELESLYRRVAQGDQPEPTADKDQDPRGGDHFVEGAQLPTAPYLSRPTEEELMKRLRDFREAYERLLTYWPFAQEGPSVPH